MGARARWPRVLRVQARADASMGLFASMASRIREAMYSHGACAARAKTEISSSPVRASTAPRVDEQLWPFPCARGPAETRERAEEADDDASGQMTLVVNVTSGRMTLVVK